jgi:hypothetical protein
VIKEGETIDLWFIREVDYYKESGSKVLGESVEERSVNEDPHDTRVDSRSLSNKAILLSLSE